MNKVYTRINWHNYPNTTTPLNETNLNKMDYALNVIDDRVVSLDSALANKANTEDVVLKSAVANNLTTEDAGYVLDARQGKELEDEITTLNQNLTELPKIQRGTASGSTGLISVTFDTPFSSTPTVVVSAYGTDANANNRVAVVRAVSNVGFQAKVSVANTGGDASTSIAWIAVGA